MKHLCCIHLSSLRVIGLTVFCLAFVGIPSVHAQEGWSLTSVASDAVPGQLIVKYEDDSSLPLQNAGDEPIQDYVQSRQGIVAITVDHVLPEEGIALVEFDTWLSLGEMMRSLERLPEVDYVEPNYLRYPSSLGVDDPLASSLWWLNNTGQTVNGSVGTNDADIDAAEARLISTGALAEVIVAVIDNGVAYAHPDLSPRMRDGTNCVDENNAVLGGCLYGYDFAQDDKNPLPLDYHGTHVAGTIAAESNNSTGIVGVAPSAQIMALRMAFTTLSAAQATYFALYNDAKIINASYGGSSFSQTEYDAIEAFTDAGWLFVAAAGNDAASTDLSPLYPASYDLAGIISVAATNQGDGLASFSNYGATTVDLWAPGTNTLSSYLASTTAYSETFQSVTPPALPTAYGASGASEQRVSKTIGSSIRLATTSGLTYGASLTTMVQVSGFSLDAYSNARVEFDTLCDTEYLFGVFQDYVTMSIATGNNSFSSLLVRDEGQYAAYNYFDFDVISSSYYNFQIELPETHVGDDLQIKFTRQTDTNNNNFSGCRIDNITIVGYQDGSANAYAYLNGTSMATPHVAGGAALLRWTRADLTASQIKSALMTYGDPLAALTGITVSGKRLNIHSALLSVYDIIPESFSFASQTGVDLQTMITGATTITGLTYQASLIVTGGTFTTNTWTEQATTGVVNNGDTVILYLTSASAFEQTASMDVAIGGVTGSFSATTVAEDSTPDAFSFTNQTGAATGTFVVSTDVLPTWFNTWVVISISDGVYRINTGSYTSVSGLLLSGQSVTLALTSASVMDASVTGTVVIWGVTGTFVVTTIQEDISPHSLAFNAVTNAVLGSTYTSNTLTVTWVNTGVTISIAGGSYSLNGGSYTSSTWQLISGDTLTLQLTSSSSYSTTVSAVVTVGSSTGAYSVTTQAAPSGGWGGGGGGGWGGGGYSPASHDAADDEEEPTTGTTDSDAVAAVPEESTQLSTATTDTEGDSTPVQPVSYDQETVDAYSYAFENGITTRASVAEAFPFGELYRRDAAKMIVEFAQSVGKNEMIHQACTFSDIADIELQLQAYMIHACRLGYMGLRGDGTPAETFRPNDTLTRAEFGTLLSRMLWGDTYNPEDPNATDRYAGHLQALNDAGIMKNIDTPFAIELRVYARILFMRLSEQAVSFTN